MDTHHEHPPSLENTTPPPPRRREHHHTHPLDLKRHENRADLATIMPSINRRAPSNALELISPRDRSVHPAARAHQEKLT